MKQTNLLLNIKLMRKIKKNSFRLKAEIMKKIQTVY